MSEVPLMVMPWHRPDPCKPLKNQTNAAFQASYMDYLTALSLDSRPLGVALTKIMCTIGPASNKVDTMIDLMQQGMTIGLVPLGLGVRQDHINTIANLRYANTAYSNTKDRVFPLSIALQTKGPGIRVGGLKKDLPINLPLNHTITLTTDKAWRTMGTEHMLYIGFPELCEVLSAGDILLLASGIIILQVQTLEQGEAVCKVVGGGTVTSFMSVSVPDVPLRLPALTDEDVDDLKLAALMKVDIVVTTRTQNAELIQDIRRILEMEQDGTGIQVWAQIESQKGLDNLESILEVADAVLLSRVSLTQDMSPNKLFLAQKLVIGKCNKAGIPVFLSAHFLPSMQVDVDPSVAELSDVASAILDGADGFVLRNTTSIGRHPQHTVKTLVEVCREAEAAVWHYQTFNFLNSRIPPPIDPTHAIAISAVEAALKSSAAAILLATTSGRSAELVARYRPRCPVIAVSRYGQVARKLNTRRAVIPLQYTDPPLPEWSREVDIRLQLGLEYAKEQGIVVPGDCLVLLNGWRLGAGFTNTIRVVYASDSFPWVYPHHLPGSVQSDKELRETEEPSITLGDKGTASKLDSTKQVTPKHASSGTQLESTKQVPSKYNASGDVRGSYPTLDEEGWEDKRTTSKTRVSFEETEANTISGSAIKSMKDEFKLIAESSSIEMQQHSLLEVVSKTRPPPLEDEVPTSLPVDQQNASETGSVNYAKASLEHVSGTALEKKESPKNSQTLELGTQ